MLQRLPDGVPGNISQSLKSKSVVVPVPLEQSQFVKNKTKRDKFTIVWNHRWEHDKWPESFFAALRELKKRKLPFQIHVLGQQFKNNPQIFERAKQEFAEQVISWGMIVDVNQYRQILRASHVVVSTALHDFQGLSILEAVANGAVPVVPDRLAYIELFDKTFRYSSYPEDLDMQSIILTEQLIMLYNQFNSNTLPNAPDLSHLSWGVLKEKYVDLIDSVTQRFEYV